MNGFTGFAAALNYIQQKLKKKDSVGVKQFLDKCGLHATHLTRNTKISI